MQTTNKVLEPSNGEGPSHAGLPASRTLVNAIQGRHGEPHFLGELIYALVHGWGPGMPARIGARDWAQLLRQQGCVVDPACWLCAVGITVASLLNSACAALEQTVFRSRPATILQPPLFIRRRGNHLGVLRNTRLVFP